MKLWNYKKNELDNFDGRTKKIRGKGTMIACVPWLFVQICIYFDQSIKEECYLLHASSVVVFIFALYVFLSTFHD